MGHQYTANKPGRNDEQERVVRKFLKIYDGLSARGVARKVDGVTYNDVLRYRNDTWQWLTSEKFLTLRKAVGEPLADEG